jgi:hypothetical protein
MKFPAASKGVSVIEAVSEVAQYLFFVAPTSKPIGISWIFLPTTKAVGSSVFFFRRVNSVHIFTSWNQRL